MNETLIEQIENEVENKSSKFRIHTIKKYIPTFTAKAIHRVVVNNVWGNVRGNRYRYTIQIGRTDGRKFTFSYYDSINAFKTGEKLDIFNAIYCVLLDGNSYENSKNFDDFVAEFGYETDDEEQLAEARRVYRGCKDTYMKLTRTFSSQELEILEATCNQY